MIKKQGIDVLDYKTFSLSDDIMKLGNKYKGSLFPRIATYIRFVDGEDEYSIINVHVDNVKKIQNKTFEEIAKEEKCTKRAVKFSVDIAIEKISKKFKN